jgi:hypothetical protein
MDMRDNNNTGAGKSDKSNDSQQSNTNSENQQGNSLTDEQLTNRNIASSIEEGGTDGPMDVDEGDMEKYTKDTDRGI